MADLDQRPKLGKILTRLKLIDDEQVQDALEYQGRSGKLFGESLLDLGYLAEDDLTWALSSQLGLPFVAVTPEVVDPELVKQYPADFLRRNHVLPLVASETSLSVVLSDPTDTATLTRLERISGLELTVAVGTPTAIKKALETVFVDPEAASISNAKKQTAPLASLSSPELAELLDRALARSAARVHLDPDGERIRVRFRDGEGRLTEDGWFEPSSLADLIRSLTSWLGSGIEPVPGISIWNPDPENQDLLPFRATAVAGRNGTSLTLSFEGIDLGRHKLAAAFEEDWSRFDELLTRPVGLIVAVAPTRHSREQILARLLSRLTGKEGRTCAVGAEDIPLPKGMIRFAESPSTEAISQLARMEGFDLLAGVFEGIEPLRAVAEAGGSDRLVIAAFPGNGTLGFLARMLEAGVSSTLLSESLLAVIAQQILPGTEETAARSVTETLFVDTPLRHALQNGGSIQDLRNAATQQGFEEMVTRVQKLDKIDNRVLENLQRHRYLEEAA